jgi:lipopolysaccharide biosynthesis glycosyltransferase
MSNCIAYIVNSKYLPLFKLSVFSLIKSNPKLNVDINLFISDNIKCEVKGFLKKLKIKAKIYQIDCKKYEKYSFNSKRNWELSPATRLELFSLNRYSKVLYLDCDTLILGEIKDLFKLKNKYIYACRLHPITNNSYFGSHFDGFNAGVILFTKPFLTKKYSSKISKLLTNSKFSGNQEAFNLVFKDNVVFVDQKYNLTLDLANLSNFKKAIIIHYIGEKYFSLDNNIIRIQNYSDYIKKTTHPLVLTKFKTIVNDISLELNKFLNV